MIRPLSNNILIQFIRKDESTASGIAIINDVALETHCGIVVAAGVEVKSMAIKHSTKPVTVYYSKFAGQPINYGGEQMMMLSEDEILGYEVQE